MPEPFGEITKTLILKSESYKLHQELEVDDLKATITFAGDLVTSNVINGKVNGVAIAPVTFTTTHANTMDLLVAAIELLASVASASLTDATNNRQITIVAADPAGILVLSDWVVTAGAGQTTATLATDTNTIHIGQPVILTADGKAQPAAAAETPVNVVGISIHNGVGGELITIAAKGFMIVFMEAGTAALVAGPVKLHTTPYNTTTGYNSVDDASVTATNQIGWSLDSAVSAGDIVRVLIAA